MGVFDTDALDACHCLVLLAFQTSGFFDKPLAAVVWWQ